MKLLNLFSILLLAALSTNSFAYGGGSSSSKKACIKPMMLEATPAHLSEAPAEAKFSFFTSSTTLLHSIKVEANKIPVDVKIVKTKLAHREGYRISGKLPAEIKKKYVRIDFIATTTNSCHGVDGWLLKMEQPEPKEAAVTE